MTAQNSSLPHNNQRRVEYCAIIAFFLFTAGIFMPGMSGIDMFSYGFGLAFISLFLAIMSVVVFIFYRARANALDQILMGKFLVHWTYPVGMWKAAAKDEYELQKKEKRGIWLMIAVICVVVGLFFGLAQEDAWAFTAKFMVALIAFLFIVSIIVPAWKYHRDLTEVPEAYISKEGVYITGEFHNWGMLSSQLEDAQFDEGKRLIHIVYSYAVRHGRTSCTVRVPVPAGQEKKAEEVVECLMRLIKDDLS